MMRRGEFVGLVGALITWPMAAWGQQPPKQPIVAVLLGSVDNTAMRSRVAAFRDEMQKLGWTDGRNIKIELRWGGSNPAAQARELVELKPDVIVAGPTNAFLPVQKRRGPFLLFLSAYPTPSVKALFKVYRGQQAMLRVLAISSFR